MELRLRSLSLQTKGLSPNRKGAEFKDVDMRSIVMAIPAKVRTECVLATNRQRRNDVVAYSPAIWVRNNPT